MNFPWAIRLARDDAAALGALRLESGLEVAEAGPELWLRGRQTNPALAHRLNSLPATARYEWLPPDGLRRIDQRIAALRLPELHWQPLSSWLAVESTSAAMPANEPAPVPLRLVRSAEEREPDLLLTTAVEWQEFAARAAQFRLERLRFAADAAGRVLVRGRPLPPLPGRRFALCQGVAVPAGFAWEPAVDAGVLARHFGISVDALVLWHEDGTLERLHGEQFVPATRSAARATAQALAELA